MRDQNGKVINIKYYKDRNAFWNEMRRKTRKRVDVKIGTNQLLIEYKALFNEDIIVDKYHSEKSEAERKNNIMRLEEVKNQNLEYNVDKHRIEKITKTLAKNKAVGAAGVINEHYKYGLGKLLVAIVSEIFQLMIKFKYMPYLFNMGIIKTIIKDFNDTNTSINNMRPLTISDTIANIYEKYMLTEVEHDFEDHRMQFGFKRGSSCQHAVFTLRELILEYKSVGKMVFLSTLDFSKAFDKTNREYLFAKMRNSNLNGLIWGSIYKYYENSCA